jgi:hypothetical protein
MSTATAASKQVNGGERRGKRSTSSTLRGMLPRQAHFGFSADCTILRSFHWLSQARKSQVQARDFAPEPKIFNLGSGWTRNVPAPKHMPNQLTETRNMTTNACYLDS